MRSWQRLKSRLRAAPRAIIGSDELLLYVLAVLIGAAAAAGAIAFREGIGAIQYVFYGYSGEALATWPMTVRIWSE